MNDVLGQRVLVTGATDVLGMHVARAMRKFAPAAVWCRNHSDETRPSQLELVELLRESSAEIIVHLFRMHDDMGPALDLMAQKDLSDVLLAAVQEAGADKLVLVGSALTYPPVATIPLRETAFATTGLDAFEATEACEQRRTLLKGIAAGVRGDLPVVTLLLGELYGPALDSRPQSPALVNGLIQRIIEARDSQRPELTLRGSGTITRDLVFVRDAAEGIALACARHQHPDPINIGTGIETTLGSLAELIAEEAGYAGAIHWHTNGPADIARQCLDCYQAAAQFGFTAATRPETGIPETLTWYERTRHRRFQVNPASA